MTDELEPELRHVSAEVNRRLLELRERLLRTEFPREDVEEWIHHIWDTIPGDYERSLTSLLKVLEAPDLERFPHELARWNAEMVYLHLNHMQYHMTELQKALEKVIPPNDDAEEPALDYPIE
jgi:hypothetical protein